MRQIETMPPDAMKPGIYLRLRREAYGLSYEHIAIALVPASAANLAERRADRRRALALLEADKLRGPEQVRLVDTLRAVFPFDHGVYWLLVGRAADPDSELPVPQICRGCACTWNDACNDGGRGCAWVDGDPTLCTACEKAGRGAPTPAPAPPAREAAHAA